MFNDIPTIETQRLRLRGHRVADFHQCVALWSDDIVTKFITGRASTEQQTWQRLLSYLGHWKLMDFGYWVIEERDTNDFVGEAGLADFKRDISAWPKGTPEIGFALLPRFHRKGYATECVAAILSWADANLSSESTACLINTQNAASLHIATKAGYTILKDGMYNEQPVAFLTRSRANPAHLRHH